MQLDFEIDKFTHSLEDTLTGDILPTDVEPLEKSDLKAITKKNGWKFDWKIEFNDRKKQVFKLILQQQPDVIQGLISFEEQQGFIFMPLIETAPHNFGKGKKYYGVMGNLVAFGCKMAFEKGFDGCMGFVAKSKLIAHYQKELGATSYGQRMVIETQASVNLINRYYPDFFTQKK
jgi:hypothetical protein